jgi:hypothetical protein
MIKNLILAVSVMATGAGLLATAPAAEARPHMICKRVWVHGHPERRCRPVRPYHRPPPPPHRY